MEIKIIPYIQDKLYFISDKVLPIGVVIGYEYTSSNGTQRKYFYIRSNMKYSYAVDGDVTDYVSGGSIFLFSPILAINATENVGKTVLGQWKHLDYLKNYGTSFTYNGNTYNIDTLTPSTTKYSVHSRFNDFVNPMATEVYNAMAGWFNISGSGSSSFSDYTINSWVLLNGSLSNSQDEEVSDDCKVIISSEGATLAEFSKEEIENNDAELRLTKEIYQTISGENRIDAYIEGITVHEGDVIQIYCKASQESQSDSFIKFGYISNGRDEWFYESTSITSGMYDVIRSTPLTAADAAAINSSGLKVYGKVDGKADEWGGFNFLSVENHYALNLIKSYGIVVSFTSSSANDKYYLSMVNRQRVGENICAGESYSGLANQSSVTPYYKVKNQMAVNQGAVIFGLKKGVQTSYYYTDNSTYGGQESDAAHIEIEGGNDVVFSVSDIDNGNYDFFAMPVSSYNDENKEVFIEGTGYNLDELWDIAPTLTSLCIGANGSPYVTCNFFGITSDATTRVQTAVGTWSEAQPYDDTIDGEIIDEESSEEESEEETITLYEEREYTEENIHIIKDNVDEISLFDINTYTVVDDNGDIVAEEDLNTRKYAITPIYSLCIGDRVNITVEGTNSSVRIVDVDKYKQGKYEDAQIVLPYNANEEKEVMFSVLKNADEVNIRVAIQRAIIEFPVPITTEGRRKKKIMEEDSIVLPFTLTESVSFPIGTYFDDEIFGRFFIVEEQLPKINDGNYKYELTFEAWHMFWKNKKYMYTALNDAMTGYVRKEMSWTLTNNLYNHALAVIHNLQAVGIVPAVDETPIVKTYAKNYILPYVLIGRSAHVMTKYKVGVSCVLRCDGLTNGNWFIVVEKGYNCNVYGIKTSGAGFYVNGIGFFTDKTENGYIDAATNNVVANLNGLTFYPVSEAKNGITLGDTTYILKSTMGILRNSRSDVRNALGMTWSDIETSVPLISKEGTGYGQKLYINGQTFKSTPYLTERARNIAIITSSFYRSGSGDAVRAAMIIEDGVGVIKRLQNQRTKVITEINDTDFNCYQEQPGILKILIISGSDSNGINVVNPEDESVINYYTWDYIFAHHSDNKSSATYIPQIPYYDSNNVYIEEYYNEKFGIHIIKKVGDSYANKTAVELVQEAYQDDTQDEAFNSEITTSGGNNVLITDEELAKRYLVIHKEDIPKNAEALTISINGRSILDGLKEIANTFECEYWVEYDSDYSQEYKPFKIHFGKCENGKEYIISDTPYTENGVIKKINATNISTSNDNTERGNKIYVFGGTENMPFAYRRKMQATIVDKQESLGYESAQRIYYTAISDDVAKNSNPQANGWYVYKDGTYVLTTDTTAYFEEKVNPRNGSTYIVYRQYYAQQITHLDSGTLTGQIYVKLQVNSENLDIAYFPKPIDRVGIGLNIDISQMMQYVGKYGNRYYYLCTGDSQEVVEGLYKPASNSSVNAFVPRITFISNITANATISYGTAFLLNDDYVAPIWVNSTRNASKSLTEGETIELTNVTPTSMFFLSGKVTAAVVVIVEIENADESRMRKCGAACNYYGSSESRQRISAGWYDSVIYDHQMMRMVIMKKDGHKVIGVLNEKSSTNAAKYYISVPEFPFPVSTQENPSTIEILNANSDAPLTWYMQDTDSPSSLLQIGENRLLLPKNDNPDNTAFMDVFRNFVCENGYIVPFNKRYEPDGDKTIEKAVIFNNEYPKAIMFVKSVRKTPKTEYVDADDNSRYARKWYQYTLELMDENGIEFTFSKDWITSETLKMRFLVPEDVADYKKENGNIAGISYENVISKNCLLAGMTFEIEYKQTGSGNNITKREYVLVRNEDFGAKLPNEILYPQVGDPVVLINWNTKAIEDSGIVDIAEKKLMEKGFEYASALAEDNFTLNADMMSQWMFHNAGEYETLIDKNDKTLIDKDNKVLKARKGLREYTIPEIGHRVCVKHGSLKNGEKHTRILGYELKLDKPYDTPRLTVGESEAYSRLKQLEKNITKLS